MAQWEDVAARARGLASRLLSRDDLDALARAPGLDALADALRARGYLLPDGPATAQALDLAVRRTAGARLRTLVSWARARDALLGVIFGDEDRRSVRALLRGALRHADPTERLAGLLPTGSLPERALTQLAAQPGVRAVVALLVAWGHEYGSALLPAAMATQPDLLTLEYRLNHAFAMHARRGARAARSAALLDYVTETIDLENACAALVLAGAEGDSRPRDGFVAGGRRLTEAAFLEAVATHQPGDAGRRIAAAFRPESVAAVFERAAGDMHGVEGALLRHRIAAQRAAERRDPAGVASVLSFALRLRAEVLDLDRLIWGIMLDAPRAAIVGAMVSA